MKPRRLALINRSSKSIPLGDLTAAAQALQIQIDRDFTPVWGAAATIAAFDPNAKLPAGTWPIRIVDRPAGGLGIHLDRAHHPYAEIMATADWTITASHEILEMLVDPYGQKLISAPDIDPDSDHHQVRYLVEVCDPCEMWSYVVKGLAVSDFVTPEYYNAHAASGTALDQLGRLAEPLEVPRGGYISWIDPADRRWHQKLPDGSFVRATIATDPKRNPRDDRDHAFGDAAARHDLPAILAALAAKRGARAAAGARPARGRAAGIAARSGPRRTTRRA